MKRIITFLLTGLLVTGNVFSQSLIWNNEEPTAGEKVTFTYNPAGTPLANEKGIEAVAYCINKKGGSAKEIDLQKKGNAYTGSFVTDTNTILIAMKFAAGAVNDPNGRNGYLLSVRDKQGKIQPSTYIAYANQYDGYGETLYGLAAQPEFALNYARQEWKEFPGNHAINMSAYLQTLLNQKKKEAEPEIQQILSEVEQAGNLSEAQYNSLSIWHQRVQQKDKADALTKEMKEKFPNGDWKKNERIAALRAEKDALKKEKLLNEFIRDYPAVTEADKMNLHLLYSSVANAFTQDEALKNGGLNKFKLYAEKMPMEQRANLYNNIAWRFAGKDTLLSFAKELSAAATGWSKKELTAPAAKKPGMRTAKMWKRDREDVYSMYADTYAFVLFKLAAYKEGFAYAKETAVNISRKKSSSLNETYSMLLEKVASPAEVLKELEPILKDNNLGTEGRAVLKRALVAKLQSHEKADAYYASLIETSRAISRKEIEKMMIMEDASTFTLKNLKGEEVSLAGLKGKVVVLDFWATWCGPCIASFPGMQKAMSKYKGNDNVVFLFINTWESQETADKRKKEVTEFIEKKRYGFNVLYDENINNDPRDYVVVKSYKVDGIPTKFVIDKEGKIRFKSVGFSGSDDAIVEEVSAMIELAAK